MSYRYTGSAVRIFAGEDALAQLPGEVRRVGALRALVVCGRSVAEGGLLARVVGLLGEAHAGTFDRVQAESPLPSVLSAVAAAKEANADLIIALGGGSAVVTARAATILLAEEGDIHDLCTRYPLGQPPVSPRLMRPKLPNMVILTTPTTATNRGGAAVLDPEQRHRLELFDPKTRPASVFLDPDALLTAPVPLVLSTSTTTLCGVIGALQSPRLNPFNHADLREALDLLREDLPHLAEQPDDGELRVRLATAALLANRAADAGAGGGGGVANGIAHQLQSRYQIDQGAANAVLAAPGMRFNREVLEREQARLAGALGVRRDGMSDAVAAETAAGAVADLLRRIGMPTRLRDLGVPQTDLAAIADDAMHDYFLRGNPRPVRDPAELRALLSEVW
jgi:alcohol dehydrogenase class IV